MSTSSSFGIRLRYASINTSRLADSAAFYERLLGLSRTRTAEDFIQLDVGGAELCLDLDDGGEFAPQLIFAVDDITGLASALEAEGVEIVDRDQGGQWLMVKDPDGNEIVFER